MKSCIIEKKNVPRLWSLVLTSDSRSLPPRRTYLYLILSSPFSLCLSIYLSVSFMWIKLFFLKFSFFLSVSLSLFLLSPSLQFHSSTSLYILVFLYILLILSFFDYLPHFLFEICLCRFLTFSIFLCIYLFTSTFFNLFSLFLASIFLLSISFLLPPSQSFPSLFSFIVLFHCHKIPEENCQSQSKGKHEKCNRLLLFSSILTNVESCIYR